MTSTLSLISNDSLLEISEIDIGLDGRETTLYFFLDNEILPSEELNLFFKVDLNDFKVDLITAIAKKALVFHQT